ncbi:MAG: hypothetical protein EBZ61_06640 [Micrococcales bacterium]|nr:hypothetical protein [Micrococcales bacterium]
MDYNATAIRKMKAFCKKWGIDYDNVPERFEFSDGNSKLKPDGIVSFNLIPLVTCPFAGSCATICYAQSGPQWFRSGKIMRVGMFKATLSRMFVPYMSSMINARAISRIRFHDSGDFYSPEYLAKVMSIARHCPNTRFYVYTKSIQWMRDYVAAHGLPDNVAIIQSRGGLQDHLIKDDFAEARIFPDLDSLKQAGFSDTSESDMPALIGHKKIGLVVHGAKKNNYKQEKFI